MTTSTMNSSPVDPTVVISLAPTLFGCELCGHLDDPRQCSYAARRAQGRAALCSSCLPGTLSSVWSAGVVWDGVAEILNPVGAVVAT